MFSCSLSSHISKMVADFFFSFLLQLFFLVQVMFLLILLLVLFFVDIEILIGMGIHAFRCEEIKKVVVIKNCSNYCLVEEQGFL